MIHVLPGMGADHRMYPPPWQSLPDSRFHDWPAYAGEDSIAAMARRIMTEAGIADGDTLVGSSLGGIVACEIAGLRRLDGLVLVGSGKNQGEISSLLAVLYPLANLAPIELLRRAAGKIPNELAAMFHDSQAEFIRGMCRAIFNWPGLDETRITPLRIHGRYDRVFPLPAGVDLVLEGGHVIAMTHAAECVAFIKAHLPPKRA
jgi:pimeloyl-ACP methyl ester carboxylesterase